MITDYQATLSGVTTAGVTVAQDLSQGAGTVNSTNIYDLQTNRDIGEGTDLYIVFTVIEAFTSAGAATLAMNCVVSAADTLTTPTSVGSVGTTALASLTLGAQFIVRINPQFGSLGLRYLGVIYTIGTATTTAGTMTAHIVTDIQDGKKFHASGFAIV
jgi:hypothetical protein